MVTPNYFGKHVNLTSQIKIVIYKKIQCCLKRINVYQIKKISLKFSIKISEQLQTRQISLVGPKMLQYHQEMIQLTPLLKNFPLTKL